MDILQDAAEDGRVYVQVAEAREWAPIQVANERTRSTVIEVRGDVGAGWIEEFLQLPTSGPELDNPAGGRDEPTDLLGPRVPPDFIILEVGPPIVIGPTKQ